MSANYCPFCRSLLDREWAKGHAPTCPNRYPVPEQVLVEVMALRRRVDRLATRITWQQPERPPGQGAGRDGAQHLTPPPGQPLDVRVWDFGGGRG